MPTVEQTLNAALKPHGVVVRFVAQSGGRRFYARRNYEDRGVYALPAPYDISKDHPWPRKAQVEDPEWLSALVATLLRELDAFRDGRTTRSLCSPS